MKCPYCHSEVNQKGKMCEKCGSLHHKECWKTNGYKCSVFGCDSIVPPNGLPFGSVGRMIASTVLFGLIMALFALGYSSCAPKKNPQRTALNSINAVRDTYKEAQAIVSDLYADGIIPKETWNEKVVPADNKVNDALHIAYGALRVYVASGDEDDFNEFDLALKEVKKLLAIFAAYSKPKQETRVVPGNAEPPGPIESWWYQNNKDTDWWTFRSEVLTDNDKEFVPRTIEEQYFPKGFYYDELSKRTEEYYGMLSKELYELCMTTKKDEYTFLLSDPDKNGWRNVKASCADMEQL